MSRVAVKKEILRWALDRSGRTFEDLRERFPKIQDWATGEKQPTLRQLESLAKATLTPLGYFFLERPPEERLPIPHYRTIREDTPTRPSPDLIETVQMMQRRQSWMRDFLMDQGADASTIVRAANTHERAVAVADKMRRALRLNNDWASNYRTWTGALSALRDTIEASGVLVVVNGIVGNNTHRKLDVEEFRGFVLVDEFAPLIFVNGADGKAAQMFTLAHELAHVLFGRSAAFDLRRLQPADDAIEKACNEAAAEFLVPASTLREVWATLDQARAPSQEVARRFKVSEIVAARRLLDLGLIDRARFFAFYQENTDRIRESSQKSGGGDFYATQNLRLGSRFSRAVIQATREGKLLFSDAYRLTGLHGSTFEQYAERLRLGVSR